MCRTIPLMESTPPTILVVEDDPSVRDALERALGFEGYTVDTARDGGVALSMLRDTNPDLVVLDVMMPYVDGIEVCRRIRAKGNRVPILMLTAKTAVGDRVEGLDAGADDYVTKPFALDELLARIRALLRRSTGDVGDVILYQDLEIDPKARTAARDGRSLDLTKTEFDLLVLLARGPGIVIDRDTIYEEIWGIDFITSSNSLDVYIGYLRRKTESAGESRLIHTVRGVGYVLRSES
jgi:two-component system response regulator MprA